MLSMLFLLESEKKTVTFLTKAVPNYQYFFIVLYITLHSMKLLQTLLNNDLLLHYAPNDLLIGGEVAQYGTYESFETEILLKTLTTGDTAIDIGANIGIYTLQMAKKIGERGRVYAFEPEPTNFFILSKNIIDNGLSNISAIPIGLSDGKGEAHLYLSWDNMGDHRVYDANYRRKREYIDISLDTLDAVLKQSKQKNKIKTIKIDTQGYEPYVIKGASHTIASSHPYIFIEYWPFGYKKSKADVGWMMRFLHTIYNNMYFIDDEFEQLKPITQEFLDKFFSVPGREESHCNLLFSH